MNRLFYSVIATMLSLAFFACSEDNVTGISENISSSSIESIFSSSSIPASSSSSDSPVLCKVSGGWGCFTLGRGDLWSLGWSKVKTLTYIDDSSKFGNRAGELFFESDSAEGGKSTIIWFNDERPSTFEESDLEANVLLDKGSLTSDPFFNIGFYIAGFDSSGKILTADISNWNGICVLYHGTINPVMQLDLGDSTNQKIGYDLPSITIKSKGASQCFEWNDFKQSNSDGDYEHISGEGAAKHVARIIMHFQAEPGDHYFSFLAIGTNRDE